MLTTHDNEMLTRVGPGTPMGSFIREFWMPFLPSRDLPERDGPLKRVRLLGEDLVAFRDSNGDVGLLAENCPHRGASLFFGRNESSGLACNYPRLEVRRHRRLPRDAQRARGEQLQGQGPRHGLPRRRSQQGPVDLHGTARDPATLPEV